VGAGRASVAAGSEAGIGGEAGGEGAGTNAPVHIIEEGDNEMVKRAGELEVQEKGEVQTVEMDVGGELVGEGFVEGMGRGGSEGEEVALVPQGKAEGLMGVEKTADEKVAETAAVEKAVEPAEVEEAKYVEVKGAEETQQQALPEKQAEEAEEPEKALPEEAEEPKGPEKAEPEKAEEAEREAAAIEEPEEAEAAVPESKKRKSDELGAESVGEDEERAKKQKLMNGAAKRGRGRPAAQGEAGGEKKTTAARKKGKEPAQGVRRSTRSTRGRV